jgi:cytoskeletal protein CcmA (bactofilin family)
MTLFNRGTPERNEPMARNDEIAPTTGNRDAAISIIGPGMRVVGDCETDGTLRIEGNVSGTVRAGKAVVVGKDGEVEGDILTQDAIIGGRVNGKVTAESRLELQATCTIEGEIYARRVKLDEGGTINGSIHVGEIKKATTPSSAASSAPSGSSSSSSSSSPGGSSGSSGSAGSSSKSPAVASSRN